MPQVVIVGAGPIGLHLALMLIKKGLPAQEIMIVDPRAGCYTRPGLIESFTVEEVFSSLDLNYGPYKHGHIKDVERQLYALRQAKGVTFVNEKFINVRAASGVKGKYIVVSDGKDNEKIIPCDYVFDCTGTNREVVKKVNSYCKSQQQKEPFNVQTYTDVSIKRHYLAYVKMSDSDYELAGRTSINAELLCSSNNLFSYNYLDNIRKLQEFGWQHYDFPKVYAHKFGKNKMCIYTELPDNLPKDRELDWVKAVLAVTTGNPDIEFAKLPPSKKYSKKPRLQAFTVDPHYINTLGCNIPGLPVIGVAGDASDEPNYTLGHGIRGGVIRSRHMVDSMDISDGKINSFDIDDYEEKVKEQRENHREQIVTHYQTREAKLVDKLRWAKNNAIIFLKEFNPNLHRRIQLEALLLDVNAQLDIIDGISRLNELLSPSGQIELTKAGSFINEALIMKAVSLLTTAVSQLSDTHHKRVLAQSKLEMMVKAWKGAGDSAFKLCKYENARVAYKHALSILETLSNYDGIHIQLDLKSEISICRDKLKQCDNAYSSSIKIGDLPDIKKVPRVSRFSDRYYPARQGLSQENSARYFPAGRGLSKENSARYFPSQQGLFNPCSNDCKKTLNGSDDTVAKSFFSYN